MSSKPTPRPALGDVTNSGSIAKGLAPVPPLKKEMKLSQLQINTTESEAMVIGHGFKIPRRLQIANAGIEAAAEQYATDSQLEAVFAGPAWEEQEADRRMRESANSYLWGCGVGIFWPFLTAQEEANHARDLADANTGFNPRKRERSQDAVELLEIADIPEIPLSPNSPLHDVGEC